MSRYIDVNMLIKKYIDTDIKKFSNSDVKIVLENLKQNILKAPSIDIVFNYSDHTDYDGPKTYVTWTEPQTDYGKGLKLFADILFDKEKSEQFLEECKTMGIEPRMERSE